MGLDMYLCRKSGETFSTENVLLYWRKANWIHQWFVTYVQDGVDECGAYEVTEAELRNLYSLCRKALRQKERAHEILPSMDGFFFGSTQYDEYYFYELKRTRDELKTILKNTDFTQDTLFYTSWW